MVERRVLVVGVSGSGKTCLIKRLSENNKVTDFSTIPTIGNQSTTVNGVIFSEVGGQLMPLWLDYAQDSDAIIFVLDAKATSDHAQAALAALSLRSRTSLPMVIYVRNTKNVENTFVTISALCLDEFKFIREENSPDDLTAIFRFCQA